MQERAVAENPAAVPETDPAPRYAGDVTPAPGAPGDRPNGPIVPGSVSDPHKKNADSNPDPGLQKNENPDPDPGSRIQV